MSSNPDSTNSRFSKLAYPIAALIALCAALFIALDFSGTKNLFDKNNSVATVNGVSIPQAEYVRAIDAMQAGLERPLTSEDKERALKIIIDEELVVQEALRLKLANDDRLVRKNLIQALINSVLMLESSENASDEALQLFYEKNKALFAQPISVTVNVLRITVAENIEIFKMALDEQRSFAEAGLAAKFTSIDLPAAQPIGKIGYTLGGKARDLILEMTPGDIAGPVESTGGDIFIWLREKNGGLLPFTDVKESVNAEWQRREEEKALDKYLTRLRKQARIKKYKNNVTTMQ